MRRSRKLLLSSLLFIFGPIICLLHIPARFFESAEGIVIGLDGLPVFVDGALALAGDVEYLAQLDMTPDFSPSRIPISVDGRPVGVGRGLVVSLREENFRDAVMSQRAIFIQVERLVELGERSGEVALLLQSLAAENRRTQPHIRGVGEHVMVGIDRDPPRPSKCFNDKS